MRTIQHLSLLGATVTTGLMAGLFFAFTFAMMPALRGADDRTFIDVFQRINVSIINPVFMTAFMGGLIVTIAALVLHLGSEHRSALPWIVAGLVLYIGVLVITGRFNIPLNDKLMAAGDPNAISDVAAVREQFEDTWNTWNAVRTLVNIAAFCCLGTGLIVAGRADTRADASDSSAVSAATWDQPVLAGMASLIVTEPADADARGGDRPEQFTGDPHQAGGGALVGDERWAPVA